MQYRNILGLPHRLLINFVKSIVFCCLLYLHSACNKDKSPMDANQLPEVNAGADAEVFLPQNSIVLTASATDPDGTISQYQWTKLFGPEAMLQGINSPVLSVTKMVEGVYTFRLIVTDDKGGKKFDDCKVAVIGNPGTNLPELDQAITEFMVKYDVPGVSIAVTKDGRLVYEKGYGYADKANNVSVSAESLFRIASVSKPITSVAIMTLVESGKLKLDDRVFGEGAILGTTYGTLPYSSDLKQVTVRHLLQHRAGGWPNDQGDPMFLQNHLAAPDLISWTLNNYPLTHTPGTFYNYSNFGYCLLGRIIEKISGQTYESYVSANVLTPCGIRNMAIGGNTIAEKKADEVRYYGQQGEYPYGFNLSRLDAAGGWIASARDLAKFLVQVDGFTTKPDILQPGTINTMVQMQAGNYALGWAVNSFNNWWHLGSLPGSSGQIIRSYMGFNWVILCNSRSNDPAYLANLDNLFWPFIFNTSIPWTGRDLF